MRLVLTSRWAISRITPMGRAIGLVELTGVLSRGIGPGVTTISFGSTATTGPADGSKPAIVFATGELRPSSHLIENGAITTRLVSWSLRGAIIRIRAVDSPLNWLVSACDNTRPQRIIIS